MGDPEMIDGYRLDSCIGSSANSALYRAHERASGGSCLIRIVSANDTDTFLHEARLASALFHPNIVDVHQAGLLDDGAFVVTEDANGRTLRSFLEDSGVPKLLTSVEIVRQAAEALHALHLAGVTHRAINPENIVVANDPGDEVLVRLLPPDFGGLAQRSTISNKFAIDGALGSIRYFSPEQCSNEETNARTDIYSLGVVFYELLAGAPPFDASSATALIHQHRSQSPPDIRIDNFELRMLITHSLTESLQKPSRLRQSSANVLARQLRHIEQLATHCSTPPPAGTVSVQPPRRLYTPALSPEPVMRRAEILESVPSVDIKDNVAEPQAPILVAEATEQPPVRISVPDEVAVRPIPIPEAEPLPEIEPISAIEIPPVVEEHAAVVEAESRTLRRSRLKSWKKKLHTIAARLAEDTALTVGVVPAAVEVVEPEVASVYAEEKAEAVAAIERAEPAFVTNDVPHVVDTPDVSPLPSVVLARVDEAAVEEPIMRELAPTKIEWDEPLDDLPTVEEVAAVLIEESQIDVEPEGEMVVTIETLPSDIETPKVIVGVPNAAPVEIIESKPELTPAAESVNIEAVVAEPVQAEPAVIIAEEIIEALPISNNIIEAPPISNQVIEAPQISNEIIEAPMLTNVEPAESESIVIEVPRQKERIAAKAPSVTKEDMGLKGDLPGFRMRRYVASAQRVRVDDEEITLVRVPKRQIQIDPDVRRDRSRPRKRPASDTVAFVPTLLGQSNDSRAVVIEPSEGMFKTLDTPVRVSISSYRRSIILGCGVIALMGLILFGNDSVTRYFQSSSSADSSSQQRRPAAAGESPMQTAVTVGVTGRQKPQPVERSSKALAAEKPTTESELSKSKSAPPPNSKAAMAETSKKSAYAETKTADRKTVDKKPIDKKPVDKKTVDKKVETSRKRAEKKPAEKKPSSQEKAGPGTRPRIVKTSN